MKKCPKCGDIKPIDSFSRNKSKKDGRSSYCRSCSAISYQEWRKLNVERDRESSRQWIADNKDRHFKNQKAWHEKNSEYVKQRKKAYRAKNLEQSKQAFKAWYDSNKDYSLAQSKKWNSENRDRVNRRFVERYQKDSDFKMNRCLRNILGDFVKRSKAKKISRTRDSLGYDQERLKHRIECQFKPGMSWSNHGKWHIDHKIPVAHFVKKGEIRPHIVNALSNLQPMWASDNFTKGARLPFSTPPHCATIGKTKGDL